MSDQLISREALKKAYFKAINETSIGEVSIIDLIDNAPTVTLDKVLVANVTFDENKLKEIVQTEVIDKIKNGELVLKAEERPQGEWIVLVDEDNIQTCKCSICGRMVDIANREFDKFPYCHCGAKMKGGAV